MNVVSLKVLLRSGEVLLRPEDYNINIDTPPKEILEAIASIMQESKGVDLKKSHAFTVMKHIDSVTGHDTIYVLPK